jgi:phosphoesterase RecJ-like protein
MQNLQEIYQILQDKKRIVITMHQKPDGDAMGAALGLYHFLIGTGHEVTVVSPTNWAKFLNWMPGVETVIDFERKSTSGKQVLDNAELLFCLDFNVLHRTKTLEPDLRSFKGIKVLIDHHEEPDRSYFDFVYSNIQKSSTCEMVYDFIKSSSDSASLNLLSATCLYTGMMTDTGSFRFSITSADVHRKVAHLIELGVKQHLIHDHIFDTFSESRLRFIGHALLHRMEVLYEYNTSLMYITKSDIVKYEIQTGDTEGLVNYLLTIQGIKLAGLVIDRTEERKWSFRSKGEFDVNSFARKHFNGGGHRNAAGGRSFDSVEANAKYFKEILKQYKLQLQ